MTKTKNAKSSKVTPSDKMLTLFQNKAFTIIFFAAIFMLLGGVVYLYQSSAARLRATVSISGDGCQITVNSAAGLRFDYGASGINKGGVDTVTVPSTGTYSVFIGASSGMKSFGTVYNNKSRVIAKAEQTLTADCYHPSSFAYTNISTPYSQPPIAPTIKACKLPLATTNAAYKVFVVAKRPTTDVVSHAAYSVAGKYGFSNTWISDESTLAAEVAATDNITLSYQTSATGYGYTSQGGLVISSLVNCR
jgi:hypothetical protein